MSTSALKRLGYGGSGLIGSVQVLITSGNVDVAKSVSFLQPLDIAPTTASRSRVKHADGTEVYTCSLAFDVTNAFLQELTTSKLLMRRYKFNIGYNDGENAWGMTDCYLTSLTVSGSAGGLLSGSVSAMGTGEPASPPSFAVPNLYVGFSNGSADNIPVGYWYSGNTNVKDWTLTMSQEVTPVFLNKDETTPRYLRVGVVSYSLQVTTYEQMYNHDSISISTSSFTLTGVQTAKGASYGGQAELGGYVNTFETSADIATGSGAVIIT
jgi:hypothetical protein